MLMNVRAFLIIDNLFPKIFLNKILGVYASDTLIKNPLSVVSLVVLESIKGNFEFGSLTQFLVITTGVIRNSFK